MQMYLNKVFTRTLDAYMSGKYSIISNYGGTRSSKTFSTMQLLYYILIGNSKNLMISVVSRSLPHLKRGCLRDWQTILETVGNAGLVDQIKTDHIYIFKNNNRIEFFGADDAGKLHGAARDILFVNECNYIGEERIKQLFVRTKGVKFLDYNPSSEFWITNYRDREDFIEFHSTYKDNDFLTKDQVREIESNRKNPRWWAIYGEGREYVREGLCYPRVIFDPPGSHVFENETYGIDFGFQDPTAIVRVEIIDDKIYCDQITCSKGLDVTEIKHILHTKTHRGKLIIADSAAPTIIHELHNSGFVIKPCKKGHNSVFDGVQLCNNFEIHYCGKETSAMAKEFKTYSYEQDLDGNYTDVIEDKNNHCMDAFRYVVTHLRGKKSGQYSWSVI